MSYGEGRATAESDEALRRHAIASLRKRHDFQLHLCVYILVNGLLVGVWAFTGGPFWPIFPIAGWGLGVSINAWDVFWRRPIDEGSIQDEIERLREERVR